MIQTRIVKRLNSHRFLLKKHGNWHYNRRVPTRYTNIDPRKLIRTSLHTPSIETAQLRGDILEGTDDKYWQLLLIETLSTTGIRDAGRLILNEWYKATTAKALLCSFSNTPPPSISRAVILNDIEARLKILENQRRNKIPLHRRYSSQQMYFALQCICHSN